MVLENPDVPDDTAAAAVPDDSLAADDGNNKFPTFVTGVLVISLLPPFFSCQCSFTLHGYNAPEIYIGSQESILNTPDQ